MENTGKNKNNMMNTNNKTNKTNNTNNTNNISFLLNASYINANLNNQKGKHEKKKNNSVNGNRSYSPNFGNLLPTSGYLFSPNAPMGNSPTFPLFILFLLMTFLFML
jgi:hypothetical protein